MVKAGSLVYAIIISLIIGLICYTLLLTSGYAKIHQEIISVESELYRTNESAKRYYVSTIDALRISDQPTDLLENGMLSQYSLKPWGLYNVLKVKTSFKNDSIQQTVLVGTKIDTEQIALYLTDRNKPLYMADKATIIGNARLPKGGIKVGYITSNAIYNKNFFQGIKLQSNNRLPALTNELFLIPNTIGDTLSIHEITNNKVFQNDFGLLTKVIEVTGNTIEDYKIKGNIIISAQDSLYIKKNNQFEDIIISAPKIVVDTGFKGAVQLIAEEEIILKEDAVLEYPSTVMLRSTRRDTIFQKKQIQLQKNSKALGTVLIADTNIKTHKTITIEENATAIGTVFSTDKVQLKGKVIGSVYTDGFILRTKASIYDNYILNGIIDIKSLPSYFVSVPIIDSDAKNRNYETIKNL